MIEGLATIVGGNGGTRPTVSESESPTTPSARTQIQRIAMTEMSGGCNLCNNGGTRGASRPASEGGEDGNLRQRPLHVHGPGRNNKKTNTCRSDKRRTSAGAGETPDFAARLRAAFLASFQPEVRTARQTRSPLAANSDPYPCRCRVGSVTNGFDSRHALIAKRDGEPLLGWRPRDPSRCCFFLFFLVFFFFSACFRSRESRRNTKVCLTTGKPRPSNPERIRNGILVPLRTRTALDVKPRVTVGTAYSNASSSGFVTRSASELLPSFRERASPVANLLRYSART